MVTDSFSALRGLSTLGTAWDQLVLWPGTDVGFGVPEAAPLTSLSPFVPLGVGGTWDVAGIP